MGNLFVSSGYECLSPTEREKLGEQDLIDKKISKDLKKAEKAYRNTYHLLLLGAEESGKSTIVKQMRILNPECAIIEKEKMLRTRDIYSNVKDSICAIVCAMKTLSPHISFANKENEGRVEYLLSIDANEDFDYPPEFWDHTKALWQDEGVKQAFMRSNEYQLLDCAQYFLDKVDDLRQPTYMPDNQDILRCHVINSGIIETRFTVHNVNFCIYDVAGQLDERRKWLQSFNNVTAIIFVVSSSSYNMVCGENGRTNRLSESLHLFKSIWNNRWLRNVSFILFLNKQDILREKIRSGLHPLHLYFEDYRDYEASLLHYQNWNGPDGEFHKASHFIKDKFLLLAQDYEGDFRVRECYSHFTTAVDTENIMRIFRDVKDIIQRMHLRQFALF